MTIGLASKVTDIISSFTWFVFTLLPKNLISFVTGWLARLNLPPAAAEFFGKMFVSVFGIQMDEAELPLSSYDTIEEIFTRKLKEGLRPIHGAFCSPCDGHLSESGAAWQGHAIQVKGLHYSLSELVDLGKDKTLSWYSTIYLAPHNYHRVHTPVSGQLLAIKHISGELWPVNKPSVKMVPQLFIRNERLIFEISLEGGGTVYVVMVGALNVGRMVTPFWDGLTTNATGNVTWFKPRIAAQDVFCAIEAGDELGTFMLGSTVVIVLDEAAEARLCPGALASGAVLLGQSFSRKSGAVE